MSSSSVCSDRRSTWRRWRRRRPFGCRWTRRRSLLQSFGRESDARSDAACRRPVLPPHAHGGQLGHGPPAGALHTVLSLWPEPISPASTRSFRKCWSAMARKLADQSVGGPTQGGTPPGSSRRDDGDHRAGQLLTGAGPGPRVDVEVVSVALVGKLLHQRVAVVAGAHADGRERAAVGMALDLRSMSSQLVRPTLASPSGSPPRGFRGRGRTRRPCRRRCRSR